MLTRAPIDMPIHNLKKKFPLTQAEFSHFYSGLALFFIRYSSVSPHQCHMCAILRVGVTLLGNFRRYFPVPAHLGMPIDVPSANKCCKYLARLLHVRVGEGWRNFIPYKFDFVLFAGQKGFV